VSRRPLSRWRRILIHHAAAPDTARQDADAIRRYHTAPPPGGRGWTDVGYHWLVERVDGVARAVPGRPETRSGSHCPGQNAVALGVCVVGDFRLAPPAPDVLDALVELLIDLCERHGISEEEIHGHRDFRQTECPGRALYRLIPDIARRVGARRAA